MAWNHWNYCKLTAQQPWAPWIPLLPALRFPWALSMLPETLESPLHLPFPDLSSAFSASPKFSFWQGRSASLTFHHDSLTCKVNVSAVPALMDIEMTKWDPLLCLRSQIFDSYHKCERSKSCMLNTMPEHIWCCSGIARIKEKHRRITMTPKLSSHWTKIKQLLGLFHINTK